MSEQKSYRGDDGNYYYASGPNKGKPIPGLKTGVGVVTDYGVALPRVIAAAEKLDALEAGGYSPRKDIPANYLKEWPIPGAKELAKVIGGEDYQDYLDAQTEYKHSILTLFAGSAQSKEEVANTVDAMFNTPMSSDNSLKNKSEGRWRLISGAENLLMEQGYDPRAIIEDSKRRSQEARIAPGSGLSEQELEEKRQIEQMLGIGDASKTD